MRIAISVLKDIWRAEKKRAARQATYIPPLSLPTQPCSLVLVLLDQWQITRSTEPQGLPRSWCYVRHAGSVSVAI